LSVCVPSLDVDYLSRYRSLIDDWPAFLASMARPLPTCLWVNDRRCSPERLFASLGWQKGRDYTSLSWWDQAFRIASHRRAGREPEFVAGFYHIQEEVSILAAYLLDAKAGERVLDLCAAPGNKTMLAAMAVTTKGTIVANDYSFQRMKVLRLNAARLGLPQIVTSISNGIHFKAEDRSFDRILLDVPCSCEGTYRKYPKVLQQQKLKPGELFHSGLQLALIRRAYHLLKPGGRLVYSTCTFRPEENELIVSRFLQHNPDMRIYKPELAEGLVLSPGLSVWDGVEYGAELKQTIRIWPHHNDTGGFYIAVMEKDI
jgi:16S rRNA C967 or C1407 C5-methylase (RsmB/RsmF family)